MHQNIFDVEREFLGCHFIMILDGLTSDYGYLVAVSEEPETLKTLYDLRNDYPINTVFYMGGFYSPDESIELQNI